jgi:hypothetical protein
VPDRRDKEEPVDPARQALLQELEQVEKDMASLGDLTERQKRLSTALAALEGGSTLKKRLNWEQIAQYVVEHPGAKPGEIAAALEAPLKNVFAHLARREGSVFKRAGEGWDVIKGWEAHRKDT